MSQGFAGWLTAYEVIRTYVRTSRGIAQGTRHRQLCLVSRSLQHPELLANRLKLRRLPGLVLPAHQLKPGVCGAA